MIFFKLSLLSLFWRSRQGDIILLKYFHSILMDSKAANIFSDH